MYLVSTPSAASALNHAKNYQEGQCRSESTQEGTDSEHHNAGNVEPFAAKQRRKPAGQWQDDRVRDKIGGQYPRAFIHTGRKVPGNVRQRYVSHARIEHFHKRSQDHREGSKPGTYLGRWSNVFDGFH